MILLDVLLEIWYNMYLNTGYWILDSKSSIVNPGALLIAIVLQNAGKQGFFVISGRSSRRSEPEPGNSGEIDEKFDYFMQNKANFLEAKMNVNSFITKDYRKKDDFAVQKNKPNSNPNKANFKIGKMNISAATIKDYDNEQRTINNERYSKQTQFKANQSQFSKSQDEIKLLFNKSL